MFPKKCVKEKKKWSEKLTEVILWKHYVKHTEPKIELK